MSTPTIQYFHRHLTTCLKGTSGLGLCSQNFRFRRVQFQTNLAQRCMSPTPPEAVNSTKESICASHTSVSVAVVVHPRKRFHPQYICICESHVCLYGLPKSYPVRRPWQGHPMVVWKVSNVIGYSLMLFPQFDASLLSTCQYA